MAIIALMGVRFEPDPDACLERDARAEDEGETGADDCIPCAWNAAES